jgi:hypothetical protein
MIICPMKSEVFHAEGKVDRQTGREMTELTVTFRNFANAPKNYVTAHSF